MAEPIWLTWETQRRNHTLSRAVGARLYKFDYRGPSPLRYARAVLRTVALLARKRPAIVFAQNPSIILAGLVTIYGKWFRKRVVIDAHNAGIEPFEGRRRWANALSRWILRNAAITLVSNETLAERVRRDEGRPIVIPDPLPSLAVPSRDGLLTGIFNAVFVCTWAPDEPFTAVIAAAENVASGTEVYITGNSRGRERDFGRDLPSNVKLTGFVSDTQFDSLLFEADVIIDLTSRSDCLVCGAYEAVAAGTPMLLSDSEVTRSYFHRGALYTDNTAPDIAAKLDEARRQHQRLVTEVIELKAELSDRWPSYLRPLEEVLRH